MPCQISDGLCLMEMIIVHWRCAFEQSWVGTCNNEYSFPSELETGFRLTISPNISANAGSMPFSWGPKFNLLPYLFKSHENSNASLLRETWQPLKCHNSQLTAASSLAVPYSTCEPILSCQNCLFLIKWLISKVRRRYCWQGSEVGLHAQWGSRVVER